MKKRSVSLLLCLLLVFQITVLPVRADEPVYFTAIGNEVQTVTDQTMPFWSGGYLYIPVTVFIRSNQSALGVRYRYVDSENTVVLYNEDQSKVLLFDLDQNYAAGLDGKISYPGGLARNGTYYIPAFLAAKYFGFEYSVTEVSQGYLVWLRQQNFGLTDKEFADAATYPVAAKYAEYLKGKGGSASVEVPESGTEIVGKRMYLCVTAGEDTPQMLDALDRYDAQAAFFCTPEFMERQGGLLRRMVAAGHSVGILAQAGDDLPQQLEQANRALEAATCGATRLVRVQNADEQSLQAVQNEGFRSLEPDVDHSAYGLRGGTQAAALLKRVSEQRGNVDIWLDENVTPAGLRAFLEAAENADGRCLAWTETA